MLLLVSKKNKTLNQFTFKTGKHNFHEFFQTLVRIRPGTNMQEREKSFPFKIFLMFQ